MALTAQESTDKWNSSKFQMLCIKGHYQEPVMVAMPIIPDTWEMEVGGLRFEAQPGQKLASPVPKTS
jgi:hypothetical protein